MKEVEQVLSSHSWALVSMDKKDNEMEESLTVTMNCPNCDLTRVVSLGHKRLPPKAS
jgi:hypothetical protein